MTAASQTHGGSHGHTPWQLVRAYLVSERGDLGLVLLYGSVVGLLSLATPITVQALVNTLAFGAVLQPIVVLTILVFAVLTLAGVLRVVQTRLVEDVQRRIFVRTANQLAQNLVAADIRALDAMSPAARVHRFFDVIGVQKSIAGLGLDGLQVVLQTGAGLVLLAFYHPILLAFAAVLVLGLSLVVFVLGRHGATTAIDESRAKYDVAGFLAEVASQPRAFHFGGASEFARQRVDALASRWIDARAAHFRIVLRQIVFGLGLQVVASAALLAIGGWLVVQRQLSLGQLVAAELIVSFVVAGIAKLGKHVESFYDLAASLDKLDHLLGIPEQTSGEESFSRYEAPARVDICEVALPVAAATSTTNSVSLAVEPGARWVFTGRDRAARESMLELAGIVVDPEVGRVEIDHSDPREVDRRALREFILTLRGDDIWEGTILDAVRGGRTDITSDAVRRAVDRVGLHQDIVGLNDGLATILHSPDAPLNREQIVRLGVARALVTGPRLLVVNGALDALDAESRSLLADVLFDRNAPWTLLLATHHADLVARADHVFDTNVMAERARQVGAS